MLLALSRKCRFSEISPPGREVALGGQGSAQQRPLEPRPNQAGPVSTLCGRSERLDGDQKVALPLPHRRAHDGEKIRGRHYAGLAIGM